MSGSPARPLEGRRVLVTGIADDASLALVIAREAQRAGAQLACAGLGLTPHHSDLSEAAARYLADAERKHRATVRAELGAEVPTFVVDAGQEASVASLAAGLAAAQLRVDGVVHAIALDRTIRGGQAKALLDVTREEFLDCMSVSAYSLIALVRALLRAGVLARGASVVALSYLGAERVMAHPYRNIGVAKAALERIVRELAAELGRSDGIRVNAVRFSPFAKSRAGGAIPGLSDEVERSDARAPLGNASPDALAAEVVHLLRAGSGVSGDVRHVDGGYHVLG
jgi:enoyl-[acyl-carrier protein] reductase I